MSVIIPMKMEKRCIRQDCKVVCSLEVSVGCASTTTALVDFTKSPKNLLDVHYT